jgi:hypothetical protein
MTASLIINPKSTDAAPRARNFAEHYELAARTCSAVPSQPSYFPDNRCFTGIIREKAGSAVTIAPEKLSFLAVFQQNSLVRRTGNFPTIAGTARALTGVHAVPLASPACEWIINPSSASES